MNENVTSREISGKNVEIKRAGTVSGGHLDKFSPSGNGELYATLSHVTDDYVFITDFQKNTTRIPPQMAEEFELPGENITNFQRYWLDRMHPDDQRKYMEIRGKISDGQALTVNEEYRIRGIGGEWVWIKVRGSVIDSGAENGFILAGTFTNLSKGNKVDNVTGLLNKFEFEKAVANCIKSEEKFHVMVMNVDDFSRINDLHDRKFGDEVLRVNAQYLQNVLSATAGVYRLDNDGFGVIFKGQPRDEISQSFDLIRSHFNNQQSYKTRRYHFTMSAGCAQYDEFSDTVSQLLKNAHIALDYAKCHGKNKLIYYVPQIANLKLRELEISEFLRESIEKNFENFEMFTQPQVDAVTGKLQGGEALLRWHCDKYGAVSPVEFIPILEDTNLILPVGRWVFETAVKQLKSWILYLPNFKMSVNVSYVQLFDAGFVDFIKRIVEENDVPFENITIELTESRFITDKDMLRSAFREIRALGIEIAMDDFGTGYSSLEILKEIPADIVKIDRAFVKNIKNSTFDMTFIKFIVELCHDAGMKVCLEGIEELEEMNAVAGMNLDSIQGFLFGKPQRSNDFNKTHFLEQSS